jgi:hypothetical protein
MFIFEVPTNGPFYFGTTNDFLSGVQNLLLALLIFYVSRGAATSAASRAFVQVAAWGTVASAISSFLLVLRLLSFDISTAVSTVVIILQAAWMLWLNTRLRAATDFPHGVSRFGQVIGGGLLLGIVLVGVAMLLPALSTPQVILFGAGVIVGGGLWVAWPVWYFLLGRHLHPAREAAPVVRGGIGPTPAAQP